MKPVNRIIALGLGVFGLVSVMSASSQEIEADFDFKLALNFAFNANIDTLILITSGGVYTTTDTFYMAILEPLTIIAKPGLAEKPIFTHSDPDSGVDEIFRVFDNFTVEGVIFDGGHARTHGMKYAIRFGHDAGGPPDDQTVIIARDGTDITVKNCDFRNMYPNKILSGLDGQGRAVYFLRPDENLPEPRPVVRAGTVRIENCTFTNIGDEAIRMVETEKYDDPATGARIARVLDSLIVRNCTFKNIDAECIRFYADEDVTTEDAYILLENLTVDSSATRVAYIKNNQNAIMRNILVTNSRLPDVDRSERSDFIIQLQQEGSLVSHVDTLNIIFAVPYDEDRRIGATKGGSVDTATIWGFDPLYVDPLGYDYTLQPGSHAYWSGHDGSALGDLRWARNTPTTFPFSLTVVGNGSVTLDPPIQGRCYDPATEVTLTAVPDTLNTFAGWSGDLSGTNLIESIMVNAAVSITATFSGAVSSTDREGGLPKEYRLAQNYPNPFNPVTRIAFDLPRSGWVMVSVYNLLGQQIAVLANEPFEAGSHVLDFDASGFSSGVYFYQLRSDDFISIRKMVFLK